MNTKNQPLNANRSGFYLKALPSAILAACLFPAAASSANLLVGIDGYNIGSFEKTLLTGTGPYEAGGGAEPIFASYPDASTSITGWTVDTSLYPAPSGNALGSSNLDLTRNSTDLTNFHTNEGAQFIDLSNSHGFGKGISSTAIAVEAGKTYRLKFEIGNHYIFRSSVEVSMPGGTWSDGTDSDGANGKKSLLSAISPGTPTNDWRTVTLDWKPKPGTTSVVISFYGKDPVVKGYSSAIAGYPVSGVAGASAASVGTGGVTCHLVAAGPAPCPRTVTDAGAFDLAAGTSGNPPANALIAEPTLTGLTTVPVINFDENIILDNVSLGLVPTAPDLVLNGSFEATAAGSQAANTTFANWTVGNNGAVDVVTAGTSGNAAKASAGPQYLDLAGAGGGGSNSFLKGVTSAEITVVAGKRYTLSFDIGSYAENFSTVLVGMSDGKWADTNTTSDAFGVAYSPDNAKLFFNHIKPIGTGSTYWQTVTATWIAGTTGKTKISIVSVDPNANAKLALGTKVIGGVASPNTGTTIANVTGTYAQNYSDNILLDNVKLQDAFTDRAAYTGNFDGAPSTTSDVLWRDAETGNVYLYNMNGAAKYTEQPVGTLPDITTILGTTFKTKVFGTGDFNGDGKADILLQSNGQVRIHLTGIDAVTNGIIGSNATNVQPVNPNWEFAGTGDFNKDGKSDIVWRNIFNNKTFVDLMNGVAVTRAETTLPAVNINWKIAGTGDFNGDGYADILWRNIYNNNTFVDLMKPGFATVRSLISMPAVNLNWQVAGTGDYNGDSKTDILWRNYTSNNTFVDFMNGAANTRSLISPPAINANWKVAGTGDYNGDGKADILWRNFVSNMTFVDLMNGANVINRSSITPAL